MGFRRVDSGVKTLTDWVEFEMANNPDVSASFCRVSLEMERKKCYFFGCSPYVVCKMTNCERGVVGKFSYSLYPFVPPLIKAYANSRTADVALNVGDNITGKGIQCEVDIALDLGMKRR